MQSTPIGAAFLIFAVAAPAGAQDKINSAAGQTATAEPDAGSRALTLPEAAALLRVDAAVVSRLAESQQIPARRVGTEWRFSRSALIAWLAGDWKIPTLINPASVLAEAAGAASSTREVVALTEQAHGAIVGRGAAPPTANGSAAAVDRTAPIGTAPEQRSASEVFLRDQRVLQDPHQFTFDVGLVYTRRDTPLVVEQGGSSVLGNAESEAFTTQLIGRYSVSRDTELFASTSYSGKRANLYAGATRQSRASRRELDDIGVGVRHTLVHEGAGRPDVILSLDARLPTGETSRAIGAGVTLVKSLDPVVLFGTLGMRRTFSRDFTDVTRLEPRHRTDVTLGYAFALNDALSLNMAVDSSFSRAASFTNAVLRSSYVATLQTGLTVRVARGIYLQPSVRYRLTGPGTGFALGLNIPFTFAGPAE